MEYITTKEASAKWGISTIRITVLANEGRIPGAQRLGRSWLIPANATKPQELKPNRSNKAKKESKAEEEFFFPLFHFRPDWSYIKTEALSEQQQRLYSAESDVLQCKFDEAYQTLEEIMKAPENTITEIGILWNAGICSIALNKVEDFDKIFLRLKMIMSKDFSHRDDLMVVLDSLKTYTQTLSSVANEYTFNTEIHDQCLPLACILAGYSQLTKEAIAPNSTDASLLELNLRLIKSTGAIFVAEFLHLYLCGIYYMRNDTQKSEAHARAMVQIAYENKCYFPLITYYRYFSSVLPPILEAYPEEFRNSCNKLVADFEENSNAFFSTMEEFSSISKLSDNDFPYIYAVLMNLSNDEIAERMNVSSRTVKRKLDAIFKILNVSNKKGLKDFLKQNM